MSYSLEDEREKRLAAQQAVMPEPSLSQVSFDEAIKELGEALDSKAMSLVMQRAVAIKVAEMARDGKVSGGDMIRLFGMLNDRADGKVKDMVEVSGTIGFGAILREISQAGGSAGLPNMVEEMEALKRLDIIDAEMVE